MQQFFENMDGCSKTKIVIYYRDNKQTVKETITKYAIHSPFSGNPLWTPGENAYNQQAENTGRSKGKEPDLKKKKKQQLG